MLNLVLLKSVLFSVATLFLYLGLSVGVDIAFLILGEIKGKSISRAFPTARNSVVWPEFTVG